MKTLYRRSLASIPRSSFVVPAAAITGGLAFFAWKPGVALSTIASPRALGFAAAVGILTVALGWVLPRLRRGFAVTALAQSVPVAIAFVVAVLPSFRTVTVNDPLPGVPVSEATADTSTAVASRRPVTALTIARSEFDGIHHRAAGAAALIQLSNGKHVV